MPAVVVDAALVAVTGPQTAVSFTAASTGDVLVLMLAGSGAAAIDRILVDDVERDALPGDFYAGGSYLSVRVVSLNAGEDGAVVRWDAVPSFAVLGWAVVSGTPGIPTDWEVFYDTQDAGGVLRTQGWDALDSGVYVALAVVLGGQPALTEPAGWVSLGSVSGAVDAAQMVSGPVPAAGAQPVNVWVDGTVPLNAVGDVWWVAAYDTGLRIRDAGVWVSSLGGVFVVGAGAVEPPTRVFPAPSVLPRLPGDGDGVVVPTPPWVPSDGPYRV